MVVIYNYPSKKKGGGIKGLFNLVGKKRKTANGWKLNLREEQVLIWTMSLLLAALTRKGLAHSNFPFPLKFWSLKYIDVQSKHFLIKKRSGINNCLLWCRRLVNFTGRLDKSFNAICLGNWLFYIRSSPRHSEFSKWFSIRNLIMHVLSLLKQTKKQL